MSLLVKIVLDEDLTVRLSQLVGSTLVFLISEHLLTKKELNSSAFSLKSVINLFSWKIGGIQGTFLPVKGYLRYKTILCHKAALDVINQFFYLKKK